MSGLWLFLSFPVGAEEARSESLYQISSALDGAVIGAGALATLLPYALSPQLIVPRCPCDAQEVNSLDRGVIGNASNTADVLSNVTVALAVALPVALDLYQVGLHRPFFEDMVVYAEGIAVSSAAVTVTKYLVQRPLPRTYAGDPALVRVPGGYRSFYSGHTNLVMVALTTASMTYVSRNGPGWLPWVLTAAVGVVVGAERVLAGLHFYSDVAVGALAGAGFGLLIPYLHRHPATRLAVVPSAGGATLSWIGRF